MLLSKLRAAVAVGIVVLVSAGVVGLAYRTTAAEPGKAGAPIPSATAALAAADDLEALRLEVEALRKSLQATRERVRTLEDEVASLKGTKAGSAPAPARPAAEDVKRAKELYLGALRDAEQLHDLSVAQQKLKQAKEAADPLAEAEAARKKLREHPDDKQAADALEKALQRLKEQRLKEQPKPEGQPGNPGKQ